MAPDVKNYAGCWGQGCSNLLFAQDAEPQKKILNTVYTGFNFVGQIGAGRWKSKK